ncbi:RadC-like JAB domain-containing protein [Pedobacter suwonensis]|uniref:RadC-like JAB domain-containing protein n=2 Tax=Pedobacter suwonensis TaxID=332999 RepID=A0A1I0SPQ7_9SPHI|nr:RadC-like JAB domain-containing protein [Pedobacter suwonensis]
MTDRLINACEMLEISMFDHLIVANEGYYSFTDDFVYLKRNCPNHTGLNYKTRFKYYLSSQRHLSMEDSARYI